MPVTRVCNNYVLWFVLMTKQVMRKVFICFTVFTLFTIQILFSQRERTETYYVKKGTGNPAVIFVSGMAEDHSNWQQVQDSLSIITTTISYDRAGLGLTPYDGRKKDLPTMALELDNLFKDLVVRQPVILVGHSLGCQVIKQFALMYPEKVQAVVYIDPGYNPQRLKNRIPDSLWQKREALLKKYTPELNTGQRAEFDQLTVNTARADSFTTFPSVPVIMFTATKVTDFPASGEEIELKRQTHEEWMKKMPNVQHEIVKDSRHYIHNDHPELIIRAIRKLCLDGKKN
jgi:pimeloyl-ACP methyl ester carboxylesterase